MPALAAQLRGSQQRHRSKNPKPNSKTSPGLFLPWTLPAWLLPGHLEVSLPLVRCGVGAAFAPDLSREPDLAGGACGAPADPNSDVGMGAALAPDLGLEPDVAGGARGGAPADPNTDPNVGAWAELRDLRLTGTVLREAAPAQGAHARTEERGLGGATESRRPVEGGDGVGGRSGGGEPLPAYRGALTAGALQVRVSYRAAEVQRVLVACTA